ncbi:MAG: hypothetical protein R2777_03755 [Chitinophagales bacterium]
MPHHLVESFKSTLDEAIESDILLHVVDVAHPNFEDQLNVVNETLQELGASDKLTFLVFNKIDLFRERHFDKHLPKKEEEKILKEFKDT